MKFCPDCSNCLYIQESGEKEKELENYCRNCGYSEKRTENKIESFQFEYDSAYKNFVPNEIVYDLTYPRTKAVECPNMECPTRTNTELREALFFKQKKSLKLTYVCTTCKTMWKN